MKLRLDERETTINFNSKESTAEVFTADKKLIKKLDGYCKEYPDVFLKLDEDSNSKSYLIEKRYISIRKPKRISDEYKSKLLNNLKSNK